MKPSASATIVLCTLMVSIVALICTGHGSAVAAFGILAFFVLAMLLL